MTGLLGIVAANATMALLLAVLVAAAARWVKRPALIHAMWLIVLLELLIPPIFEARILPVDLIASPPATVGSPVVAGARPSGVIAPVPAATTDSGPAAARLDRKRLALPALAGVWLIGATLAFGLAIRRVARFRRGMREAPRASPAIRRRLRSLSTAVGLRRTPVLRMVDARISPCVWLRAGGVELLFPRELASRLTAIELDTLLTHELAHVARRDHWVRYLELVAVAVFWWHPVAWWARARLRRVEEQCCDQIVLRTMDAPGDYARGLLKTIEYLAGTGRPVPALASGVGEARQMEERLTMIMNEPPGSGPSRAMRVVLAAVALGLLLVVPTWTERAPEAADAPERDDEQTVRHAEMLKLERRALELEEELRRIRGEQVELKYALERRELDDQLAAMRLEARQLEGAEQVDKARAMREQISRLEQESELRTMMIDAERDRMAQRKELELPLRRQMLEIEELRLRGEVERAEELEQEARAIQQRLERAMIDSDRMERDLATREARAHLDQLLAEAEWLRERGRTDEAERLELGLERRLAELERQLAELHEVAAHLEREGRHDERRKVERRIEELRRRIEYELSSPEY